MSLFADAASLSRAAQRHSFCNAILPSAEIVAEERMTSSTRIPKLGHVIVFVDGEWNVAKVLGEVSGDRGYRIQLECTHEYLLHKLEHKAYGRDNEDDFRWVLTKQKV
jgi:hypothetical protein